MSSSRRGLQSVERGVRNLLLVAATALLILKAVPARGCSVTLEWAGPAASPTAVRAVADGCQNDQPAGNAFALYVESELRSNETICRYDSQPCYGTWHFILSCDPPGNYTVTGYKDLSTRVSEPFTVPEWSKPTVTASQPYRPAGSSTYHLPVTIAMPLFGGAFACPRVTRVDGATGAIYTTTYCPAPDEGTTTQYEVPLSGNLTPPSAGNVNYVVSFPACDDTLAKDAVQMDLGDPSCNACPDCVGDPIRTSNGNMRYSDIDPLPGDPVEPFVRTLNSGLGAGYFSHGWSSPLDSRAAAGSLANYDDGRGVVSIRTPNGDSYVFGLTAGQYEQLSPTGVAQSELRYDAGTDSFYFRRYGSHVAAIYSATTGRILAYRDTRSGRETRISSTLSHSLSPVSHRPSR